MKGLISVVADAACYVDEAKALACKHGYLFNEPAAIQLLISEAGFQLKLEGMKPQRVDFCTMRLSRRVAEGRNQAIAKACLAKTAPRLLDLTAGWGRDGALLASLGADVTLLERHPLQALLLDDGLKRLYAEGPSILRFKLFCLDAVDYLKTLVAGALPDVIYFDPMHPVRRKSALVKKDMQALQALIGEDTDKYEVAHLALSKVLKRLVIKWPAKLAPLLGKPSVSYQGKTIRYDVYFPPDNSAAITTKPATTEKRKK